MAFHENREYTQGFPITAKMFDNLSFLAHWHSELELIMVYKGSLGMGINSEYKVFEEGDIVLCYGGSIHYYDSKNRKSTVLSIVFRPELIGSVVDLSLEPEAAFTLLDSATKKELSLDESVVNKIKSCFDLIYKEMQDMQKGYQIFVKSHLIELFGLFSRYIPKSDVNTDNKMVGSASFKLIQRAIKYIDNNYSNEITLEDVSEHLKISPFYFSRVFSKVTGVTFKTYLNTVRIEKAQNLIKSTSRPIIDIAYDCGFTSIRTFNRVFRMTKDITPSSLR